jgi:hypothetical protein
MVEDVLICLDFESFFFHRSNNIQMYKYIYPQTCTSLGPLPSFYCPRYMDVIKGSRFYPPTVSFLTTCVSVCYWRNPIESPRKNADLLLSKKSGVTYFLYGSFVAPTQEKIICGIATLVFMLYSYYLSCTFYREHNPLWIPFLMAFHY